MAKF
jgi:hypothetical protein